MYIKAHIVPIKLRLYCKIQTKSKKLFSTFNFNSETFLKDTSTNKAHLQSFVHQLPSPTTMSLEDDFFEIERISCEEENMESILIPFNVEMFSEVELQEELRKADELMDSFLRASQLDLDINNNATTVPSKSNEAVESTEFCTASDYGEKFEVPSSLVPKSKATYAEVLIGAQYSSPSNSGSSYVDSTNDAHSYVSSSSMGSYASSSSVSVSYVDTPATSTSYTFTKPTSTEYSLALPTQKPHTSNSSDGCSYATHASAVIPYCFAY
jgi:hypothetical protein